MNDAPERITMYLSKSGQPFRTPEGALKEDATGDLYKLLNKIGQEEETHTRPPGVHDVASGLVSKDYKTALKVMELLRGLLND